MSRIQRARFQCLFVVLAFATLPLSADTIATTLSSLTPPYVNNTGDSWSVGGSYLVENAVSFTDPSATVDYSLTQIQVADNYYTPDPNGGAFNDLMVSLWESPTDLNSPSATELESWTISTSSFQTPELFTLTPSSSNTPSVIPTIDPGVDYFVVETVPNDGTNTADWGWQENNLVPFEIGYYAGVNGTADSWLSQTVGCAPTNPCFANNPSDPSGTPAFSVSGNIVSPSAVPEPRNYAVLLAAGFIGILLMKRRRAVRG